MVEIREAPVPVGAWDMHPSNAEVRLVSKIDARFCGLFVHISCRPLRVLLSNGQTIIVRAKK